MAEALEKVGKTEGRLRTLSAIVELLKSIVDVLKSCAILMAIILIPFVAKKVAQPLLDHLKQEEIERFEFTNNSFALTLREIKKDLDHALKDAAPTQAKGEQSVSQEAQNISAALSVTHDALQRIAPANSQPSELWVYLGSQDLSNWTEKNFNLTAKPGPGMTLTAISDVYKRNARPRQTPTPSDPDNLDLGDPVGVLKQGEKVILSDVAQIRPNSGGVVWWGRIR